MHWKSPFSNIGHIYQCFDLPICYVRLPEGSFIHYSSISNHRIPNSHGPFILHWWPPALIHGIRSGSGLGLITGANPRAETSRGGVWQRCSEDFRKRNSSFLVHDKNTPKSTMESKVESLEDYFSLQNGNFQVPHVSFRGVSRGTWFTPKIMPQRKQLKNIKRLKIVHGSVSRPFGRKNPKQSWSAMVSDEFPEAYLWARVNKKWLRSIAKRSSTYSKLPLSSWWLQPIWKMFPNFPKLGWKKIFELPPPSQSYPYAAGSISSIKNKLGGI